ncbi:hypothetical protein SAMN03080617_00957 [Algoriphagus alkaliphilus]|uniref:Outer membrane protein beta-barrel domain-containing protein n=1 Tax=Algoriphagus alkaliphilus TaxID=279824 RepID=A0A1G5W9H8_9BACT|nr:hypothetical protein [Algoriphagus alkaliphilus]MBA4302475.1 hypothetical protein [Cyclobacterium sp.]SDA54761.1 hypothetical protein SAMN03080617_00957 [Algoriphagus alkaliphilus]
MTTRLLILGFWIFAYLPAFGQNRPYFNQTELGVLIGNPIENWSGKNKNRVDFSLISFHGAEISKNQVLGLSVGLDQYEPLTVFPVALGWRGFLGKENRPQLIGGFDLGGGFALLEKKEKTEWYESWHQGGLLLSPSIGVKLPSTRGKKTALTMSIAYKRQELGYFMGNFDFNPTPRPFTNSKLPPGYSSITETTYLFHSLVARMGFIF